MTSLPLFGHTEAALGDFTFDRANELQIEKLKIFRKVDLTVFPTSYPTLTLDISKVVKSLIEVALCIYEVALRVGRFQQ